MDRSIVDSLAKLLLPNGFTMWGYSDWRWKVKRADKPTWGDALSSHGFLDPEQEFEALNGPPPRFPPPVDRGMIDNILLKTRAIIFLNSTRHKLSAGMKEELLSLRRLQRVRRFHENRSFPPPVCLWCTVEGDDRDPYPLDTFGDGDLAWAGKVLVEVQDADIKVNCSMVIMVALAGLLLEQRAEFVRQLLAAPRNTAELTDCFGAPEDELSRCLRVQVNAQPYVAYEPLRSQLELLQGLVQNYASDDLDWAKWKWWHK